MKHAASFAAPSAVSRGYNPVSRSRIENPVAPAVVCAALSLGGTNNMHSRALITPKRILLLIVLASLATIGLKTYQSAQIPNSEEEINQRLPLPQPVSGALASPRAVVRLGVLPSDAALVYHRDEFAYVMDSAGARETQMTFNQRAWEHLAISQDRRFMVGNEHPRSDPGRSLLWLYDLKNGTETQLVPNMYFAGDGGVDWDQAGFVYFKCKAQQSTRFSDICKVSSDGTGFTQLTNTPFVEETDVAVSEDGRLVAFALFVPEPKVNSAHTEIWVMNSDGRDARMVYRAGTVFKGSAHDPEISPDNTRVIFSMVNSQVPPNFPNLPAANTAHDIWSIKLDGTGLERLTKPGPISIIPDWQGNSVVYTEISEKEAYQGTSMVNASGTEQTPRRIKRGANSARWVSR